MVKRQWTATQNGGNGLVWRLVERFVQGEKLGLNEPLTHILQPTQTWPHQNTAKTPTTHENPKVKVDG